VHYKAVGVLDQGLCIGLSFACHLNYKKGVIGLRHSFLELVDYADSKKQGNHKRTNRTRKEHDEQEDIENDKTNIEDERERTKEGTQKKREGE